MRRNRLERLLSAQPGQRLYGLIRRKVIPLPYSAPGEYSVLCALPAEVLSKTRHLCLVDGVRFVVDEFQGALAGLRLAEIEVDAWDDWLPQPTWLGLEVSQDDRYSGGRLARASSVDRRKLGLDQCAER